MTKPLLDHTNSIYYEWFIGKKTELDSGIR